MSIEIQPNQQSYWENEHSKPSEIPQVASTDLSYGVKIFYDWLQEQHIPLSKGLEMCCGKGRNVLGLSRLGITMFGFDFDESAIVEAFKRIQEAGIFNTHVWHHNAYEKWPFPDNYVDFALDVFGTADMENSAGRKFAATQAARVIKPGGLLLVYNLSSDDEWSQKCLAESPLTERNSYFTPQGKFEKCFDRSELIELYSLLRLIEARRMEKTPVYNGTIYPALHHWMIFQKGTQNS